MARMIITMPDSYFSNLDQQAKEEGRTRSEIVRELVRINHETRQKNKVLSKQRAKASKMMDEVRAGTVGSDYSASEFIRAWRYRET